MGRMFEDDTYVDDQCCKNCKWWNRDILNDHLKCCNRRSEKKGKETDKKDWCWCWQKETWRR